MKSKLYGKKLLILGATPNEVCIVNRAHEYGIYVVVTDYNTDHSISPAKDVADEFWDVSWSDIETLEKLCKENKINGVIAGYSEIRVDNAIKLCERLGLPFYLKDEQLEITRNKDVFKKECKRFDIPVIKEYQNYKEISTFPVIVKPTDRAGSIGVSIANNKNELIKAYEYAMSLSIKKRVIIEDYITDCSEFDVHYAIMEGKINLISSDDVIHAVNNEVDGKVIQSGWLCPEKFQEKYLSEIDPKVKKLIESIGIKCGTIFFSGFVSKTGDFRFFECGFRLWGPQEYKYTEKKGIINYLDIYLFHSLCGNLKSIPIPKKTIPDLKYVALWIYSKAGKICEIKGFDDIKNHPLCSQAILYCRINQECSDNQAILSRLALFEFYSEVPSELKEAVDFAYQTFKVKGENGEEMIYDRISSDIIPSWWN